MDVERRLVGLGVAAALAFAGCSEPARETQDRRGDPAVYQRINASTDCQQLQREFDIAMTNAEAHNPGDRQRAISLSYADAADARLRKIGCYDN